MQGGGGRGRTSEGEVAGMCGCGGREQTGDEEETYPEAQERVQGAGKYDHSGDGVCRRGESGAREEERGETVEQVGLWWPKVDLQEVKMVEVGRTCDWWGQGEVVNGREEPRVFWQLDEELWGGRERWPKRVEQAAREE